MPTPALCLHQACTAARRPKPLRTKLSKLRFRPRVQHIPALSRRPASVICQALNFGQTPTEPTPSSVKLSTLDTKQRRRLLVQFTCNKCGAAPLNRSRCPVSRWTRSERLVNPVAYENGTVFVQCQGCEAWHKLVDNMNLIEEYDLREMPLSDKGEELLASLKASERDTESESTILSDAAPDSQLEPQSDTSDRSGAQSEDTYDPSSDSD